MIDEEQTKIGGKTISRERKIELLEQLLTDTVSTGEKKDKFLWIWGGTDVKQPRSTFTLDPKDDAYVKVGNEEIMLGSINPYMRGKLTQWLESKGIEASAQNIANYWVLFGKPTANSDTDFAIWQSGKMNKLPK